MLKTEILKLLRESDGYVSGQDICKTLGVSRTAVWKVIQKLSLEGYEIEAVRNKGYHIVKYPDSTSKEAIASLLETKWAGQEICYLKETDSTNTQAKRLGEAGACHGMLVVAEEQKKGKGRRGKTWISPAEGNIYMSLLLRPDFKPAKAPMLTLVMAYSIASVIRERAECNVKIKWPNDIVLHKKKVCGILTEMSTEIDYINYVVIGAGINVNMTEIPDEINSMAGALAQDGSDIPRAELIADILIEFERQYGLFEQSGDLHFMVNAYNDLLINQDREVQVLDGQENFEGKALGINASGELLVQTGDGTVRQVFAGEVSVRGLYGYV